MPFEKYKGPAVYRGSRITPNVTIRKSGSIAFNKSATEKFKILNYKYVTLYFNKGDDKIGFKLTDDINEEGKHIIRKQSDDYTAAYISARAFLDFYKIDYDITKIYDVYEDKENGMLVAKLNFKRLRV